jgi:hypothetical protein
MPGVTQDQVEVDLHDNVLRLEGRLSPQEYEGLTPVYTEYNVGNYLRRFTLTNAQHFDRDQKCCPPRRAVSARRSGCERLHLGGVRSASPSAIDQPRGASILCAQLRATLTALDGSWQMTEKARRGRFARHQAAREAN